MLRKPFETGLPRWAFGKACPAKATPTTTLWRKTFSAVSNVNWFTCTGMTPAVLLKRIFLPISRPFTIRCARIPPLTGSHRALLNCGCVMPLSPDLRDFTYYCDSFRFFPLFTVYFFGKGSKVYFFKFFFLPHLRNPCGRSAAPPFPPKEKTPPYRFCIGIGEFSINSIYSRTISSRLPKYLTRRMPS